MFLTFSLNSVDRSLICSQNLVNGTIFNAFHWVIEPERWGTFSSSLAFFYRVLFYLKIYLLIYLIVSWLATISICSNGFLLLKNINAKFHFRQIQQSLLRESLHSLTICVSPPLEATCILRMITRLSASSYGPSMSTRVLNTDSVTFFTSWWLIAFIWLPLLFWHILLFSDFIGQDILLSFFAAVKSYIRVLNMNFLVSFEIKLLLRWTTRRVALF